MFVVLVGTACALCRSCKPFVPSAVSQLTGIDILKLPFLLNER